MLSASIRLIAYANIAFGIHRYYIMPKDIFYMIFYAPLKYQNT